MSVTQQIVSMAVRQQERIEEQVRVDVFDGAGIISLNLAGGTVAAGAQEIGMTDYQYYANCGVADSGGIRILVPGIYVVYVYVRLQTSVSTRHVPLGISVGGLPVYTIIGTSYHVGGYDLTHSACGIRRLMRGEIVRLVTQFGAATAWQWASLRLALAGMLR